MKEPKTIKCTHCCAEIKVNTNAKVLKCSICEREYENPYYVDKKAQTDEKHAKDETKKKNPVKHGFINAFVLDDDVYAVKKKKYTDLAIAGLVFAFVAAFMSFWDSLSAILTLISGRGLTGYATYIRLAELAFAVFCIVASSLALKRRKQPTKKDCVNLAITIAFSAAILVWYVALVLLNVKALRGAQNQIIDLSGIILYPTVGIVPKVVYLALCGAMLTTLRKSAKKTSVAIASETENNQETEIEDNRETIIEDGQEAEIGDIEN